jgi:hypothetical protein
MEARLESGDVSLTARIAAVLRQFVVSVVARNFAAGQQIGKAEARRFGQLAGLTERQNPLSIKRYGQLRTQARRNFRHRQSKTLGNGFRNFEIHTLAPLYSFYCLAFNRGIFASESLTARGPRIRL